MTIQQAYRQVLQQLFDLYEERETQNIANLVIEYVTGQSKIDRITYKDIPVSEDQQAELKNITEQLLTKKPIQYVLRHAWFMDMKLSIDESVLIPRPETEELVEWIIRDIKQNGNKEVSLFDIGTGSGCIPIAVRKKIAEVAVSAIDVSDAALNIARLNSIQQEVLVDFLHLNFLDESEWKQLGKYNIIVSNPPYIRHSEKALMRDNVLNYEPHLALFVPDENALRFYEAIAKFAYQHLKENGTIYLEINEALGAEVMNLFQTQGYENIELKKDMQGKDRMIKISLASTKNSN